MFSQKLSQLKKSDIEKLLGSRENDELEFKQTLATRSGNPDPWMEGQKEIGKHAKSDLTKEVVAFANSAEGVLVLGIGEDERNCAASFHLLPDCQVLADRLGQSILSSVDPKLEQLECEGVEFEAKSGVVVIRVGASGAAPHRDRDSKEAYSRTGDKSEPMGMRQIQDMALDRWRGRAEVEMELSSRTLEFERNVKFDRNLGLSAPEEVFLWCGGWRATSFPLEKVFRKDIATRQAFRLPDANLQLTFGDGRRSTLHTPELLNWRPMLRGIICEATNPNWPEWQKRTIEANGMMEIKVSAAEHLRSTERLLHVNSVFVSFAQLLVMTEVFRQLLDRPRMEFAFEFEWIVPNLLNLVMPSSQGYLERLKAHTERNRLRNISMVGDTGVADVWIELQREFFQSFGRSVGNVYPIDFDIAVRAVLETVRAM